MEPVIIIVIILLIVLILYVTTSNNVATSYSYPNNILTNNSQSDDVTTNYLQPILTSKHRQVYFRLDNTNLYLNINKIDDEHHFILSENKNTFIISSSNPEYVEDYYIKAFRNDNHDYTFSKRYKLDKIVFIEFTPKLPVLIEIMIKQNKCYLISRVHMCGDYAYFTINDKNLEFDGKGPKATFSVEAMEYSN